MALRQDLVALGAIGSLVLPAAEWKPPIRTVRHLLIKVEVLAVRPPGTLRLAGGTIECAPGRPGKTLFPLDLTLGENRTLTELVMEIEAGPESDGRFQLGITTIARIRTRDGRSEELRRERTADAGEGSTFIHQVHGDGRGDGRGHGKGDGGGGHGGNPGVAPGAAPPGTDSILATLTVETMDVPELVVPSAGVAVVFRVFLLRVEPSGVVPLQEGVLRTLEGEAVSYAFRRSVEGPPDAAVNDREPATASLSLKEDDLELRLLPTRASEGILMVEAVVSRRIDAPGRPGDRAVIARRTQAVTRGGAFELTLGKEATRGGAPYRFVVRPEF